MTRTRLRATAAAVALTALAPAAVACTRTVAGNPHAGAGSACSGGQVVQPRGAPYCYVVPSGLTEVSGSLGGAQYTTAVALDRSNVIVAGVFPAPADLDQLSDAELASAVDELVSREDSQSFRIASTDGTLTKPPAGRALEYHATTDNQPPIKIDFYIVSRGHVKVQINCQSTTREAAIGSACQEVVHSLRITSTGG